jgi:hypothetical protein
VKQERNAQKERMDGWRNEKSKRRIHEL